MADARILVSKLAPGRAIVRKCNKPMLADIWAYTAKNARMKPFLKIKLFAYLKKASYSRP